MNEPKGELREFEKPGDQEPAGTPPSGGERDETMGGTDNTTDFSMAGAARRAREKARPEEGGKGPT
jgi:hypothetical protein